MESSRSQGCCCPRSEKGAHRASCFSTSTPTSPRPSVQMNPETRSIGTFIESPQPSRRQQYVQTVQECEDDDSKPVERRPEPSNANEPLKWRPELSNSDETTKKRPLLSTRTYPTKIHPESSNSVEPVKRSPEPSNSNKPLKWRPEMSHSDETTKKRPMLGISTYPTKMRHESSIEPMERRPESSIEPVERRPEPSIKSVERRPEPSIEPVERRPEPSIEPVERRPEPSIKPVERRPEPSIEPVERRPEPSNSNELLKGRHESSNSDKGKTRRPLLSNRTYISKTNPKTININESLKRRPKYRRSRESLKSVNGEERKSRRERERSRGPAQWCRSCLRWSACVRKQSSSDQQIASPKRKAEPESSIFEPRKKSPQKDEPCKEGSVSVKSQECPDVGLRNGQTNNKESKSRAIESVIFHETYVAGKTNNVLLEEENTGENVMTLVSSRKTPPPEKQIQMLMEEESTGENLMSLESSRKTPPPEKQIQMLVEEENKGENILALESSREAPSPGKELNILKENKTAGKVGVYASSEVIGSPLKAQLMKLVEKRPSPPQPILRASRRRGGLNRPQTPAREFLERKKLQLGYKRKIHPSMPHKDVSTHGGTFHVSKALAPAINLPRQRIFSPPTSQWHQYSRSPCTVLQTPPSYTSTRRSESPCYCFEASRLGNLSPGNYGPRENLCYCNVPDYVIQPCQSCCSETRDIIIHPPTCGHCRCPAPSMFILAVCSQPRRYQHMLGPSLLQSLTRPVYRGNVFQERQVFYHDTQELNSILELSTGYFESKKNTCTEPFPLYKNVSTEFKERAPTQKSMESGDAKRAIKVERKQPQHVPDYRLYSTERAKRPVLEFSEPYDGSSRENKSTISCESALSIGNSLVRVLPWHLSREDVRRGVEEARRTGEATVAHSTTQYVQPWLLRIEKETLDVTSTPQKIYQCLVDSDEDEPRYTCVQNVSRDEQKTTMTDRKDEYRNDIHHNTFKRSSKEWRLPLQQKNFGEIFNHPTNNSKMLWTGPNTTDDDNETSLNTSSQNKSALDEESFRESIASDERVRAAPIERPSKRCECDCHPLLPGQVSDMCTCKCDACNAMGTPRHRFNEVYEDWPDDPCTSTHVQRDVHMSRDDPQRPREEMTEKSHARFLASPPAQPSIATQVPSLRNTSTQTETLECQSCRRNQTCGGSQVQPVEIASLRRARHERVPWEEPERVQLVAPEESHRTILQFRLVPPQTGPLFTAQKESPTNLRPVTRLYRVDRDGDDELEEYVERSPHHIRNPKGKRRSLISTSSEGSVVTCRRGTDRKDSWLVFKVVEGVLAIVCLALSVRFYQNFSRPTNQKASSYQERLLYSESLKDLDDDNSTTFAPNSRDTRDQGLPTLVFAAFWAACACVILILVASIAAICWGKRFCNLILIVLAILGAVAFLVFGILFVLAYKDRYPKRAVKLLMVFCFILAAVFLVDLIYCICIRGKHRT